MGNWEQFRRQNTLVLTYSTNRRHPRIKVQFPVIPTTARPSGAGTPDRRIQIVD
jgi:hypothetical protein